MSREERGAFLGLYSNVHFFASQQGFKSLEGRVKALSLLYDKLLFETGIYNGHIGEEGSFQEVAPFRGNPEELKPVRTRKDRPLNVMFSHDGSDEVHSAIHTPTVKLYRAQFITILQDLGRIKADWAYFTSFALGTDGYQLAQEADRLARDWMWRDREILAQLEPDTPQFWRNVLISHLFTDLARSSLLGLDIAPDGRHDGILRGTVLARGESRSESGIRSLSLLLPDIRQASWQDIADLRKDRGIQNLRARLREFDADGGSDAELIREINAAYAKDMERYRPSWRGTAVNIAWNLVTSVVSLGLAPTVIQSGKAITDTLAAKEHWTASLMRLRSRVQK